ncbi:unnamed protein product [Adineta ricciae]|uniref:PDZ domain-containing protein n=1 Tax=Adineta ricciae TaxID=249248 RepID=A0A816BKD2_ADIRI|nr:unnamed protein product [Adineta ricciae]CAF1611011.1 unnamed protein product [Adineta ricciae]
MSRNARTYPSSPGNGDHSIPLKNRRVAQRPSIVEPPDLAEVRKSSIKVKGVEYQLLPVEIEKDAEIGLVLGQVDDEPYIFIDEVLPNGMIDMHGVLKEGDYLIQAGSYSLIDIDITTALVLVERAYEDGRKTVSFVAARSQKPNNTSSNGVEKKVSNNRNAATYDAPRKVSRAQSFVEYENNEEEERDDDNNPNGLPNKDGEDDTRF